MTSRKTNPLPDFKNPPVIEVVLGVQFNTITELRTPQLGLLWKTFKKRFPRLEEHRPLDPVFEKFEEDFGSMPRISLKLVEELPVSRCWFLNEVGSELIQVQADRFIHNWRKVDDSDTYPRYEKIRKTFEKELKNLRKFFLSEGLGKLVPNQWEVTYVNHIIEGKEVKNIGQIDRILTVLSSRFSDSFLKRPESVRFSSNHVIFDKEGVSVGRLHIKANPVIHQATNSRAIRLELTARGAPEKPNMTSVLRSLDLGREYVVRGFASITTKRAHKLWGRRDGS